MTAIRLEASRVLVLGRSPDVLEMVTRELAELGIAVRGSSEPERATAEFDAGEFDLIAFGRGLRGQPSEHLRREFRRRNAEVRFVDTEASTAVRQVMAALDNEAAPSLVDLDAYCARIGYRGPRTPTLETLRALVELHPAAIVFEAIDVLLKWGVDLDPAAVDAKLIQRRRGGYCYEQNGLFKRVLATIGFDVEGLIGRVRWMATAGRPPMPRSHMALRVTLDGVPWLVDVGIGGCVPTAPLRLDSSEPQPTQHEAFRIIPFGAALLVQARLGDVWQPMYELFQEPQLDVDYEPANWFMSTHPTSHFRHELIVARTTNEARYTLLNGRLTIRRPGGQMERRSLDADGIEQALAEVFALPVERDWRAVIERAAAAATP